MIKNLTPHTINIVLPTNEKLVIPASGIVARVSSTAIHLEPIDGIPVVNTVYGEVVSLPEPEEGVIYIVSAMVLSRVQGRPDVFGPDTGPTAIRDEGKIVAVRGLVR